jgi:hypothetical protein
VLGQVSSGEQLDSLPALMGKADVVVMNALDWQVDLTFCACAYCRLHFLRFEMLWRLD